MFGLVHQSGTLVLRCLILWTPDARVSFLKKFSNGADREAGQDVFSIKHFSGGECETGRWLGQC
jgi:hypothetical protein